MPGFLKKDLALVLAAAIVHAVLALLVLEPFGWPLVGYVSFLPLLFLVRHFRGRLRWLVGSGFVCALAYAVIVTGWVLPTLMRFMEYSFINAILDLLAYSLIYFLKYPLWLLLAGMAERRKMRWLRPRWLWSGLAAVAAEWAMPSLFKTHWGIGVDGFSMQLAEISGIYGLTFLLVISNFLLFWMLRLLYRSWRSLRLLRRDFFWCRAWPIPLGLATALVFGVARTQSLAEYQEKLDVLSVAVLQPNTPPTWLRSRERLSTPELQTLFFRTLPALAQEAAAQKPDLLVFPEGAIPYYSSLESPQTTDPAFPLYASVFEQLVLSLVLTHNIDLLYNEDIRESVRIAGQEVVKSFNVATYIDRTGLRSMYRKQALMPGEEIPVLRYLEQWGFAPVEQRYERLHRYWPGSAAIPFQVTRPARAGQPSGPAPEFVDWMERTPAELRVHASQRQARPFAAVMPLICSEDLETLLPRQFFADSNPQAIINLTQDGWYGDTLEPHQHAHYARIRSIETRRSLVRATNSGISAAYGLTGKLLTPVYGPEQSSVYTRSVQVFHVPLSPGPPTLYMRYGMLWFWLLATAFATAALLRHFRFRHRARITQPVGVEQE